MRTRVVLVVLTALVLVGRSDAAEEFDCTKVEAGRKAACNLKVLDDLGRVKTSDSTGQKESHNAAGNQQGRQEQLRSRFASGNPVPWPPYSPLDPADAETARLLIGDWEGWRTDMAGSGARRVAYTVTSVNGADVAAKFDGKSVPTLLSKGSLEFELGETGAELPSTLQFQRSGFEELRGVVFLRAWDGAKRAHYLIWLTKKLPASAQRAEQDRVEPDRVEVPVAPFAVEGP